MCLSQCNAGKFAASAGLSLCSDCPAGFFQPLSGNNTCLRCDTGKIAAQAGSAVCTDCLPGTYNNRLNSSVCSSCEDGKFMSTPAQNDSCLPCLAGSHSTAAKKSCQLVRERLFVYV